MGRHHFNNQVPFDPDRADYAVIDVEVSFTTKNGEVENVTLETVAGKARPWGFHHWSDSHFAALVAEQVEAQLEEMSWEERREGLAA